MLGYSRDSFYRFKELYEKGGELALAEISRKKPVLKNRAAQEIEDAIVALATEQPAFGQVPSPTKAGARGFTAGVRCVWPLFSGEIKCEQNTFQTRCFMKAMQVNSARQGPVLIPAELQKPEKMSRTSRLTTRSMA